jgi:hypothetical protein
MILSLCAVLSFVAKAYWPSLLAARPSGRSVAEATQVVDFHDIFRYFQCFSI